jgi:hypothetical protein
MDPNYPITYYVRGLIHFKRKNVPYAIENFTKFLSMDSKENELCIKAQEMLQKVQNGDLVSQYP